MDGRIELKPKEYEEFRSLVYSKSGITLGQGKESLVTSRISKRMRALGLGSFGSYLDWLNCREGRDEMVHMLDAISTNVTSFFREEEHFDFLRGRVQAWRAEGRKRFRFWSAACSSGEEPYTLAMTLCHCGLPDGCDVRILATDLSSRVLETAREGLYPASKLDGLPAGFEAEYFAPEKGSPGFFRARDRLRELILFQHLNLAFPPFPMKGPMDAIFVRNVMIYFDDDVRRNLLAECARLLRPGGILMVGHSESLTGLVGGFDCLRPSIYQKRAT
jgi:chemotaxis protein methyltransferase CheR